MKALETTVEGLQTDLGKATKKIDQLNAEAVKASTGVAKLNKQFRSFTASLLAAGTAQRAFNVGLDRIQSNARLVALARSYDEIEQAQAAATRTAEAFNLSQTEANKQFAAIYGRLRPLGLSVGQIEDAYAGLSTAVKTASLDAAGASALFTQVSQALGSGVVQAEELNTVIDQAPSIVVALAKELGVTAGEVKKLASTGKVSSEQLYNSLLRVKNEGVDVLSESLNTPAEKIKAFYNTTEDIVAALTISVIPELVDSIDAIAEHLEGLIPLAQIVGRGLAAAFKLASIPAKGFGDLLANIRKGNWDEVLKFDPSGIEQIGDIFSDLFAPLPAAGSVRGARDRTRSPFPSIPDRGGSGSGSGSSSRLVDAANREAERIAETLRDREQLVARLEQQMKVQTQITDLDKLEQELQLSILEINQEYDNLLVNETNELIRANTERARALDLELARGQALEKMLPAAQGQFTSFFKAQPEAALLNDELSKTDELLKSAYETVANGLTGAIKGLIQGTTEWQDVLSNVLGQLGQMFLNAGFNGLGTSLKIPGFEGGGYTGSGSRSGGVDGKGGFLSVLHPQETVIDHRAPMGRYNAGNSSMAAPTAPTPTFRLETQVINGVEYATVDQVRAMGGMAAKQGASAGFTRSMQTLKNSRSQRARLGM